MPRVIVTDRTGGEITVVATSGETLMAALRDYGNGVVDADFGLCGGSCSCYTCHVWVEESFLDQLPPVSAHEEDLLELADEGRSNSRLGCQVTLTDTLDGLHITLPPAA